MAKTCVMIIARYGKNRYKLVATEGARVESIETFNDMTSAELHKILLDSKGYKFKGVTRAA